MAPSLYSIQKERGREGERVTNGHCRFFSEIIIRMQYHQVHYEYETMATEHSIHLEQLPHHRWCLRAMTIFCQVPLCVFGGLFCVCVHMFHVWQLIITGFRCVCARVCARKPQTLQREDNKEKAALFRLHIVQLVLNSTQ